MKKLTVLGMALLLLTATAAPLADGKGYGKKHGNQHYQQKGHKYGYYNPRKQRYNNYRSYRGPRYYSGYYRPNFYNPSYLGAALIGSALTYSLYHTHNGAYCNDNHESNNYQAGSGNYSEVVGCHRMERLPDGSELRIEVPLSQCN